MSPIQATKEPLETSIERRNSDELIKLVRKLRWMGFETEAERIQRKLTEIIPLGGALTAPHETD